MNTPDVIDVLELFVAERKLSRRKLAFLETVHQQTLASIDRICSPHAAGQFLASELDLPQAHFTCQLVADVLDFLNPLPDEGKRARLIEITEALVKTGHLEPDEAESLYEDF